MSYIPCFNERFVPLARVFYDFERRVNESGKMSTLKVAVSRHNGLVFHFSMGIFSEESHWEENYFVSERMIKSALWIAGGYKITVFGSQYIYNRLKKDYNIGGKREFDYNFMSQVYERQFTVEYAESFDLLPEEVNASVKIGGHLDGCRIGFDAGGSDRKVSALIDGKVVFSEETIWRPKESTDWHYQYNGIRDSIVRAREKLPRLDGIGVSSAGVCIDNKIMVSSLFIKIPRKDFDERVKGMYLDIGREFSVPITLANDGDVAALSGAMSLKKGNVLGISLGTSEAGGYINESGNLNDYISELAFVPIDVSEKAYVDEWSLDSGVGAKYLSQDGAIALAEEYGITFASGLSKAEKLEAIIGLLKSGDGKIVNVYKNLGQYLGHAIGLYGIFYKIEHVLLLGRVTSGGGGAIMATAAKSVLDQYYPNLSHIEIIPPTDGRERLAQSITAATLTDINN